ncbi:hypothetical protein [Gordonia jacobaea]|uniref:hypothetical protein n=1 Tax=Gordonia jacobaea TaxID=122202 RepID=UPI003D7184D3
MLKGQADVGKVAFLAAVRARSSEADLPPSLSDEASIAATSAPRNFFAIAPKTPSTTRFGKFAAIFE